MSEASKIEPVAGNRARLRLQTPRPRPLAELANSSYSAFVNAMKIVLPAIAVGIIILVVAWPQFQSREEAFKIGLAKITMEDIDRQRMLNPRYQDIDRRGEPFTVTARTGTKDAPNSDVVELDHPQADVTLKQGNWVTLKADYGAYREQDQQLDLIGKVNLFHDSGYEFHTLSAHIDMKDNSAEGDDPVDGQGPSGAITSEGFRIYDKGQRIIFTGKAHLLIRPHAEEPTARG